MFVKIFEVGGESESFGFPVGEPEESTDTDAAESTRVGTLGALEAPVEIFLGAGGVKLAVGFAVVGFLVNNEPLGTMIDEFAVLIIFHRAYFDRYRGDEGFDGIDTRLEISFGDKFGMFSCDQEDVSKAEAVEVSGFCHHLGDGQRGA